MPGVRGITPKRREHLRARWSDRTFREQWALAVEKIAASKFCHGEGKTGWVANFDWFIRNADSCVRTLEGKYDNRNNADAAADKPSRQEEQNWDKIAKETGAT